MYILFNNLESHITLKILKPGTGSITIYKYSIKSKLSIK